jgi:putative endonuclease
MSTRPEIVYCESCYLKEIAKSKNMYYLYILKCADKTLYTGITVDLKRRIKEHNHSKLGAKYTRARRPVKLVYSKKFRNRSSASKEESRIKHLSREEKLLLIKKIDV